MQHEISDEKSPEQGAMPQAGEGAARKGQAGESAAREERANREATPAFPAPPAPDPTLPHPELDAFIRTIALLRSEQGCPWDREQTNRSIARNIVEEAFEAQAAIEDGDFAHFREELGDVLLEVVLHAQIAADEGRFTLEDVAHEVNEKMIRRHPHVFGAVESLTRAGLSEQEAREIERRIEAKDSGEVIDLWHLVKGLEREEKARRRSEALIAAGRPADSPEGVLDGVPFGQPALMLALEVSDKTARLGFEWPDTAAVWEKVREEEAEFRAAAPGSTEAELEFGDLLFALVNVARKEGIDPEAALLRTCRKFRSRWERMERAAEEADERIGELGAARLEELWQQAKRAEGE